MTTPTEYIKYIKYLYGKCSHMWWVGREGGIYKKKYIHIYTCVMGDVGGLYSVLEYDTIYILIQYNDEC